MRCLVLFFFLFVMQLFSLQGLAVTQYETDRRELVTAVYNRFPAILAQVLNTPLAWTPQEKEFLYYMLEAAKVYTSNPKGGGPLLPSVPLRFSGDPDLFKISKDQPPRSAVIGPRLGDPIFVNLNVINNKSHALRISDVVQLFLHEFGHFVPKHTNDPAYLRAHQAFVDAVAAKFAKSLEPFERVLRLSDGTTVHTLSGSHVLFGTIKTPTPMVDQFLAFNPFFFFVEMNGTVRDQTKEILEKLETRKRFEVTKDGARDYQRMYYWSIESAEEARENDPKRSWIRVRATQVDAIIGADKQTLDINDFQDTDSAPNKAASAHEFVVGLRTQDSKIDRVYNVARHGSLQIDEDASIKIIQDAKDAVTVRAQFDDVKYGVQSESQVQLLLQVQDKSYAVSGKRISPQVYEFKIEKPQVQFEFTIQSLSLGKQIQVFFPQGLSVKSPEDQISQTQLKLKKIGLSIEGHYQPLRSEMEIETKPGFLEFVIESSTPLREIELYESKSYRILNEESNRDFARALLRPELKTPSIRNDFQLLNFSAGQFNQEEVRPGVYKVTVPYDLSLSPLKSAKMKKLEEEMLKKNPFDLLFGFQRYMEDLMKQPVAGTDLGVRALYHIRLTNQNFEEVTIHKEKPFYLRVFGKKKEMKPALRQCRTLFF